MNCECSGNGWIKEEGYVCWCDCKIKKIKQEQMGVMFENCDLSTVKLKLYQKEAQQIIEKPEGSYYIVGEYGKGKTHLLACLFDYYIKKYRLPIVKFFRETDLINDWQDWEGGRFLTTDELKTKDIMCIILDDIGRAKITERVQQEMYSLIDWVYTDNIKLLVSSNYKYDELSAKYGGATTRRIKDMCQTIKIGDKKLLR